MRRLLLVVLACIACLAAACGSASGAKVLATYSKTGGIAGMSTRLTVHVDGAAIVTQRGGDPKRHRVRKATIAKLRRALDAAHVERAVAPPKGTCNDCFETKLTYEGHTLTLSDGASTPARVQDALSLMGRIAAGGK